ncbi:MAG TPA: GntR family transcriptional regulator [Bacillus bacterium]|uniref:GntR family transcriptional regulator n=1 Tax=Siminovitchia fordii TaxID=254759 RepID=A0ABQ4K416_9BACI|nr:GntR family transcriptional regulator [Siminovitchia fordii]GIN20479.1 GntR family transcriptional regulator [Siminovitchia fordii]HBZ08403.1 GntR family transcriptional regulator [Bacillus sp. (in: firmicutes)]
MRAKLADNALSNSIAKYITEQIITGEIKPGEKLVEHIYADQYGTSRAPVREAIYLLAIEGLVERIPRKGAVVKEYTENEIYDLLEIRNMLENMGMERIKRHGVDQDLLKEMRKILEEMKETDDVFSYTQLNHSFHMCLIKMSKSETIKNMYLRLGWPLLRVQSASFSYKKNIEKSVAEHERIVKLLHEANMEQLSELLGKHNKDVILSVQKMMAAD